MTDFDKEALEARLGVNLGRPVWTQVGVAKLAERMYRAGQRDELKKVAEMVETTFSQSFILMNIRDRAVELERDDG